MSEQLERTPVVILTASYRIKGKISLIPDNRITDFILHEKPFIVLTDVEVMERDGTLLFTSKFINVKRDQIEVIAPEDIVLNSERTAATECLSKLDRVERRAA